MAADEQDVMLKRGRRTGHHDSVLVAAMGKFLLVSYQEIAQKPQNPLASLSSYHTPSDTVRGG
jgi:hypothetical protein